ncbi:MAG: PQQ-binding-like beta-propeller repeat protein [Terriglobales bacterium]
MRHSLALALALAAALAVTAGAQSPSGGNWLMFGGSLSSPSSNPHPTGITAANVGRLRHQQLQLPGMIDASAIYIHGAEVAGARHDTLFLTALYGKTFAIDASSGQVLWTYTPPSYSQLAGSRQVTNSVPAADPSLQYLYTASPDGYIQKLSVADGHALWRTSISRLPLREKMDSGLKVDRGHVVAVTGGYNGDRPPYQGHVAILDAHSGKLLHVWNSLCSNRAGLLDPSTCAQSDSAIWGRPGAQIDSAGNIFVATGNADWNGSTDWGDAVIELNSGATTMLANYTPTDTQTLNDEDLDLGSTAPVLLGGDVLAQGGKDGLMRLLSISAIAGTAPHKGHELQLVPLPAGEGRRSKMMFSQPAVWRHNGQTWMFGTDAAGTVAWVLDHGKLQTQWSNLTNGTSPFEAGGLLFVYNPEGGLNVFAAASGNRITTLACPAGHWSSPIVVDGHIILPEGNANRRATSGTLDIWSVR